ncbi:gephyrin-like molybdotransferase Glp [Allomesorhizobium alhagi]|uniref:Molybdopterin molybdenumtransferase n=1 Tax=Mesorhizobium alhagi CCNWXJ12-2 TaxID=1107882 RepID=H0I311_9HYPH|nr:gephyrin-like molybdotransferase Glp [Mesorhizobium alhagi]EHK52649.1 molybdenum cofactor synthesis domain-containing protein [Mesorhizobium alhagi CCNWXJ12-2]
METATALTNETCGAGADGKVIPVDIAAAKALTIARVLSETEHVPLIDATGRVLAGDVRASIDLPPFDNSAMDGYGVRIADFIGAGPWELLIGGRIAAGDFHAGQAASPNEAIRIFTGAPVPEGFDVVVMQEHCERSGDEITVAKRPRQGENIRHAGEDVTAGSRLMSAGDQLSPQRLALLAGQGLADVEVLRKVRVGLISTGSELRDPGEPLGRGQIYNSNRIMIRAMFSAFPWAEIVDYGIVPDRRDALAEAFGKAASLCDVLVTTGGVSAGEEDHVVSALGHHGGTLDVLKVAMRPGKPVKIGMIGTMLFAGLPGNPNAALVTFRQIALPAIRTIAGIRSVTPEWSPAVAGFTYQKRLGRTEFVPVKAVGLDEIGRPVLDMLGRGSSASLMAMALADGIAMLPPDAATIDQGMPLRFESFRCG